MTEISRTVFARPCLSLYAVLLLAGGMTVGQERRRPTLEGGVRQQERRQEPIRGGVRQEEEVPDETSLVKMAERDCRAAREVLDLYRRAAANPELVSSDDWKGAGERLYTAMSPCLDCPIASLDVYIELLRRAQIARADPRARAETYKKLIVLETGNDPARGPVSLQVYDQAVQTWRRKVQDTLTAAEGCFHESCTETLRVMRDALPPERRARGGVYGQGGEGGVSGGRPPGGGVPPLPREWPSSGSTTTTRGPASRETTPRPRKGTKSAADDAAEAADAAASVIAGAPPWKLKLAEGVTLSVTEEAVKKGAVQAATKGAVTVAAGVGVAVLGEGAKDAALGTAAATGMVCVGSAAINQQLARAKQFELHSWEHHRELQRADRDWQAEQQRHLRQMDELARNLQDEPRRHAEAMRRLEQQEKQVEQRHRDMMKSADANAREVEQRRYQQNRADLQRSRQQEEAERNKRERLYREEAPRQEGEQYRRNVDRIIDRAAKTPEERAEMRRQAEQMKRYLEQMAARPTPRQGPQVPDKGADARHQLRLEKFRREWDTQWGRYQGYLDSIQMEWDFEMRRHDTNPFKNTAEAERHAAEIARLNAKARCLMGDHLAALDAIRLKYQLW
jgi:hypothetical protein